MIDRFVNTVFHEDALDLLRKIPTASVDAVISAAMYGAKNQGGVVLEEPQAVPNGGNALALLRRIPPASVDAIITDAIYGAQPEDFPS